MLNKSMIKESVSLRLFIIVLLSLILLIPTAMIMRIIKERSQRNISTSNEISSKWGKSQTLIGPVLNIPYKTTIQKDEKKEIRIDHIHLLPEELKIVGDVQPEIRHRGIFKAILYTTEITNNGCFNLNELKKYDIDPEMIQWKDSYISYGISDLKGIKDEIVVKLNDIVYRSNPGLNNYDLFKSGINSTIIIDDKVDEITFSLNLNINGSEELYFIPIGKTTQINLSSSWNTPSFIGEFLPESYKITNDGFISKWKILHFNRNYPQVWIGKRFDIDESKFGLKLIFPVDEYQKSIRVTKYAIMFIGLTFLAFFIIEVFNKKVLHPIQYILIGLGLVLFYSLLISLSEYMAFSLAYFLSSISIIIVISLYTKGFLSSTKHSMIIAVLLIILYVFMYVILQLQDYSLLVGSVGLLIILSLVMYITRKINWFTVFNDNKG